MRGNAKRDAVEPRPRQKRNRAVRAGGRHDGQRAGPEGGGEPPRVRVEKRESVGAGRVGNMGDERIEAGPLLRGVNRRHRAVGQGACAQPIDRLGGKSDKPASPQDSRRLCDRRRIRRHPAGLPALGGGGVHAAGWLQRKKDPIDRGGRLLRRRRIQRKPLETLAQLSLLVRRKRAMFGRDSIGRPFGWACARAQAAIERDQRVFSFNVSRSAACGRFRLSLRAVVSVCLGAIVVLGPLAANARESAYAQPPVQIGATQSGNYLSALIAGAQRDTRAAAVFFREALRADPRNPVLLERAFVASLSNGDMPQAFTLAERLVRTDPKNGLAHLALGVRALKQRQFATAARILPRAATRAAATSPPSCSPPGRGRAATTPQRRSRPPTA